MPHHKRGKRKSARAGCTCQGKIYKHNGFKGAAEAVCARDRKAIAAVEPVEGYTPPVKPKRKATPRPGLRRIKRKYIIEHRDDPNDDEGRWFGPGPDWVKYASYRSPQARDEALRCLQQRVEHGGERYLWRGVEYRAVDK